MGHRGAPGPDGRRGWWRLTRPNVGDKVVEEEAGEAEGRWRGSRLASTSPPGSRQAARMVLGGGQVLADVGIEGTGPRVHADHPDHVTSTTDLSGRAALGSISGDHPALARRAIGDGPPPPVGCVGVGRHPEGGRPRVGLRSRQP